MEGQVPLQPEGGLVGPLFLLGMAWFADWRSAFYAPAFCAIIVAIFALVTMRDTLKHKPEMVARFVKASMEGWKSYLADPAPANALIKKDNPNMTDEQLAYSVAKLKEMGVDGLLLPPRGAKR